MVPMIGEFFRKSGKFEGEWRIPNFLSLPEETDKPHTSGEFFFSDACWELTLYPNGESQHESEGWISLYLHRRDRGPPITLKFSMGIRKADGGEEMLLQDKSQTFSEKITGLSADNFLKRSNLINRKDVLAPSEVLTVIVILESNCLHSMDASLGRRLWNTRVMLRELLLSQEGTDVNFKLKDGELRAHKAILKARSETFGRLFTTGITKTGEVVVPEADTDSFRRVMAYAYSGDPTELSSGNVCGVYKIAQKYGLGELARLCVEFMQGCLSLDTVCDVAVIAETYKLAALKGSARDFFVRNAAEIIKTDKWETLKKENPDTAFKLFENICEDKAAEIKI